MTPQFTKSDFNIDRTRDRWYELCAHHLPIGSESIWRFSRPQTINDPHQGWKLHVSATVRSATDVLERIGPILNQRAILFKAPKGLQELARLNTGRFYGYSQIGKCFTVYPRSDEESVRLAKELDELTSGLDAPSVPFENQLKPRSCVYYRYGSFKPQRLQDESGNQIPAIRTISGELVPDSRVDVGNNLAGLIDPFLETPTADEENEQASLLKTRFRVFKALSQRGKGGVYWALDMSGPRLCVLKEGRKHGETCWDGRDGFWRIKQEWKTLKSLAPCNIGVPNVLARFVIRENLYLVTEFIEGVSLERLLRKRKRRLRISQVTKLGIQLSSILTKLHSAGWVWRDCKPANLILLKSGLLRPIDFEGACRIGEQNPIPLGTLEYLPNDYEAEMTQPAHPSTDLYALGAVLFYLLHGEFPSSSTQNLVKFQRRVPSVISRIVSELLDADASMRPTAEVVAKRLERELLRVSD
jgi:serine/threonine protein kinase